MMNAIMEYPGSKRRIAGWIIQFFPPHHSYLEPFFGSGAVLFQKCRSNIETINDLDGDVVNLFKWIRNDPERMAHEVYYTPYARSVYEETFRKKRRNSFQRAVDFYIQLNMSYRSNTNGERTGWKKDVHGREYAYDAKNWCGRPYEIFQVAERLRGVQIECMPAVELIQMFNFADVLIYCNPPYVLSSRNGKRYYKKEMTEKEHEGFLEVMKRHKGSALISGYASELYSDMLHDWHKETIENTTLSGSKRDEVLWMNFKPAGQISIFDFGMSGGL